MPDLLSSGVGWLSDRLEESASTPMIYRRGALSCEVKVTRGRSEYNVYDDMGNLVTEVTDADFLMAADKLVLDGSITEPQSGDRLEETAPNGVKYYEVMARGGHRPFTIDPSRQRLRIRTKLVKETA